MKENAYLYVLDNNIVQMMLSSAISLRKYNSDKIYVFSNNISDENKKLINNLINNVQIIEVNGEMKEHFSQGNDEIQWKITNTSFSWMLIPELLKEKKILYLDCDTYIRKRISKIFKMDIDNKTFASVPEIISTNSFKTTFQYDWIKRTGWSFNDHAKCVGMNMNEYNFYVNSGVILVDVDKMRKKNYLAKMVEWNKNNPQRLFNDQDVLNAVAKGDIFFLNGYWNYTKATFGSVGTSNSNKNFYNKGTDAKIIHYAGKFAKPFSKFPDPSYKYKTNYMRIYNSLKKYF